MSPNRDIRSGIRRLFTLPLGSAAQRRADADEELDSLLDSRIDDFQAKGLDRQHAEAEARRRLAGDRTVEDVRRDLYRSVDARENRIDLRERVESVGQDARLALRHLVRAPVFTAVALGTLALGIGANTAVYSLVSRALVDRLPYHEPDRLVVLYGATSVNPANRGMLSAADIDAMQRLSRTMIEVAPFGLHGGYTYVGDQATDMWQGTRVGSGFFHVLGVRALLGRTIDGRDVEPGAAPVVILSYGLWQRVFGGDSAVIGRAIRLNDSPHTIIGVMPPDFVAPVRTPEIWTPLNLRSMVSGARGRMRVLTAVGRLSATATLPQARSELDAIVGAESAGLGAAPRSALRERLTANPLPVRDAMVGEVRPILLVVMAAALLVLFLAIVNIAGLVLARATSRRHELTVRSALGAGRLRLVRQLLTETILLALAGAGLGIALAFWGTGLLVRLGADVLPAMGQPPHVDAGALAFAVALAIVSGLAFGALPALIGTGADLGASLGESSRGAAGGRASSRGGRFLVAGQVTLAVVLLVCAGLLGRTLMALEHTGMGYRADDSVLTFRVNLSARKYAERSMQGQFFRDFLRRVRALPGVESAGLIEISPWNGWYRAPVDLAGTSIAQADSDGVVLAPVSDGYFSALGMHIRVGRGIEAADQPGTTPVAVVSAGMARELWPSRSPIGAQIRFGGSDSTWHTVVGIVDDVREQPAAAPSAVAYVSTWQQPQGGYEFVVHAAGIAGSAATLVPPIRRVLRELDPLVPLVLPRTMGDVFRGSLEQQRLPMIFTTAFALLALVLSALGIYGVTAFAVTARSREIGIRSALGGGPADILRLVLRQGMLPAGMGAIIGLGFAAAGARGLAALLYGVTAHDVATFVGAPLVLLVVGAAACIIPARRALRIDPVAALRVE